ncbi:beta-1,3-galactosyltransferase 5-like [Mizuhopecten yessoensis]|uniref:Hexosyltransferase n=1 Tax=Mizuhopecten yessoensis TaxID=6573 RepID=A0A210QQ01_MIZYE|nr:beta-1,3-galactosyltransferase 5-like [Mizuhopecten yessoensis]OWF50799.1 UDP-GlcNAc:betaGal beta-1,3-N-acetylglucosaminyltransferase 4 [Mizuhopecten yessoensis]
MLKTMGKCPRNFCLVLTSVVTGLVLMLLQSHSQLEFTWSKRYVTECNGCNKFVGKPTIEPTNVCKQYDGNTTSGHTELIILVMSPVNDKEARDAVRDTWGGIREQTTGHFRVVFVVGKMKSTDLFNEASSQGDILQLNVPETQKAITEKVVHSFRWFTVRCSHIKYVMKTDTEVFINVPYIFKILQKYDLRNIIVGHCYHRFVNHDRSRNTQEYKTLKKISGSHSPPYCSGSGYLIGRETAVTLTAIFADTPYFPVEDVYIGMCAYKTKVEVMDVPGFDVEYVGYDAFQYCHCAGTVPKVDAGRQREIFVRQLGDCKQTWSRGMDDLRACFVDIMDVLKPLTIMTLSGLLIILFFIVRRKVN